MLGAKFIIWTNHKSLQYLLEQTITTEAQQKWLVKLLGYDFLLSLSRTEELGQLRAFYSPHAQWIEPIKAEIAIEPELQQLVS